MWRSVEDSSSHSIMLLADFIFTNPSHTSIRHSGTKVLSNGLLYESPCGVFVNKVWASDHCCFWLHLLLPCFTLLNIKKSLWLNKIERMNDDLKLLYCACLIYMRDKDLRWNNWIDTSLRINEANMEPMFSFVVSENFNFHPCEPIF